MASYEKPLPIVNAESQPYWEGAKQHKLMIQHCGGCGKYVFYPRALCPHCYSDQLAWEQVSGEGAIYTFTVCHRAGPDFRDDVPFVAALVDLKEGARMMTNIVGCPPEAVSIGRKVKVVFDDVTEEITLPKFELAD